MVSKFTNSVLCLLVLAILLLTYNVWQLNETQTGVFQAQKFLLESLQIK
ncbi:hypothetical protein [Kosakonia cowanii]|jgi:hypothetical protein|nr:hypothetical protein [Kosakonia cowanii]MDT3411816.1 hypothetical protein [Atlantibacter sp. SORGH_AS_0304]